MGFRGAPDPIDFQRCNARRDGSKDEQACIRGSNAKSGTPTDGGLSHRPGDLGRSV
jgi:hypothetical protein